MTAGSKVIWYGIITIDAEWWCSDVNKDWTCKDKDKDKNQAYKEQDKDKDFTCSYCKLQLNQQSLSSNNNEHKVKIHNIWM